MRVTLSLWTQSLCTVARLMTLFVRCLMFSCWIRLDNNKLLPHRVPFEIEITHHKSLKSLTKFVFNCWHFKACLYTFLFKRCPEEGYYISHWSLWENYQPLLTSSMSHPHAESCETLDCLTKPQDRESIDYHFSSLLSAFRHTISEHLNRTTPAKNLPSYSTSLMCAALYSKK